MRRPRIGPCPGDAVALALMEPDTPAPREIGRISAVESPGALELVTGSAVRGYRTLTPDDPLYDAFVPAWQLQAEWEEKTHFAYWQAGLRLWPRRDGQVPRWEALGLWVWSWRRFGLSDQEIADRLGYPLETLRRKGALKLADEHASRRRGRRTRVPLVVAVEREDPPHPLDTWYDPRLAEPWPESVRRVQKQLARMTWEGPRGRPSTPPIPAAVPERPEDVRPQRPKKVTTSTAEIARWFEQHRGAARVVE
jgi:hypothetical protein